MKNKVENCIPEITSSSPRDQWVNSYLWPYSQPLPEYHSIRSLVQIPIKQWNSMARAAQFYFSLQTIYLLDVHFGLDFINPFYIDVRDCCFFYRFVSFCVQIYHKQPKFVRYWFEILQLKISIWQYIESLSSACGPEYVYNIKSNIKRRNTPQMPKAVYNSN